MNKDEFLIDNFEVYLDSYYGEINVDGKLYNASEIIRNLPKLYDELYEEYSDNF